MFCIDTNNVGLNQSAAVPFPYDNVQADLKK